MFLTNWLQHKFSKKLRRSIITGYSQFMSGVENGAESSYVGNDVNTFHGDVIVAYPVVGNGIAQSLYYHTYFELLFCTCISLEKMQNHLI